jgi:metal-dependent amidase/aminoacylase/carboxypeptidase family protein
MIRDGLWQLVQPDYLLSHHIAPDLDAGKIVAQGGHLWASMDQLSLRLGREDAAPPHVTLVVARIVSALYEAVEAEAESAQYPPAFAVGVVEAIQPRRGAAGGRLEVRYVGHEKELRRRVLERIRRVAEAVASEHHAALAIEIAEATAPIVNDAVVGEAAAASVRELFGESALVQDFRHPVSDDFSLLQEKAPGAMVLFGTRNTARGIEAMWHTPEYDADEDVLSLGAATMAASVLRLLEA